MSAACCDEINRCLHQGTATELSAAEANPEASAVQTRSGLFNRVTALLLTVWFGIVTVALETASVADGERLPTLDLFLKSLF